VTLGSASLDFIAGFADRVPFKYSLYDATTETCKHRFYHLTYHGQYAAALCEWMYQDSEGMRLTRKYERWLGHKERLAKRDRP
jgi:hypothetical protein